MKTLLDRLIFLHTVGYKFKEVFLIAIAVDNNDEAFKKAYDGLKAWANCFDDVILKDLLIAKDIDKINDILNYQDKLLFLLLLLHNVDNSSAIFFKFIHISLFFYILKQILHNTYS